MRSVPLNESPKSGSFIETLNSSFCKEDQRLCDWYREKLKIIDGPIYSSYDIRDSGFKIANVDANIFPAGFNNICARDKKTASQLLKNYIHSHIGPQISRVLLVTEEHTKNPYYKQNVLEIQSFLEEGGFSVLIGTPHQNPQSPDMVPAFPDDPRVQSFNPNLILSNNDFSLPLEDWIKAQVVPILPSYELGWHRRRKNRYFHHYNALVHEFAEEFQLDPFLMTVKTEVFEKFDIKDPLSLKMLSTRIDEMLSNLREEYAKRGLSPSPFVFVKNNSGTYGLGVVPVERGSQVEEWSYQTRKRMKAAKGGRDIHEVIIQEGIPTIIQSPEGFSAEPVIYMIGSHLAGGFLRTHSAKDSTESLNSPGAVYKPLCVSELLNPGHLQTHPLENVYGWTARLGFLAIGLEAQELGVQFKSEVFLENEN